MIYYTECESCGLVVHVLGDLQVVKKRLSLFNNDFPCVSSGCFGRAKQRSVQEVAGKTAQSIPLDTYFRGIHDLGMEEGDPATPERVKSILLNMKIKDVVVEPVGQPRRTLLWKIVMEDDTALHLAHSGKGPCVYRVEHPWEGLFDGEHDRLHPEGTATQQSSSREEAG